MISKKIKSAIAAVVTAGLLLAGVNVSQAATKTLTLGIRLDVADFNASKGEFANRAWYYQAVYDTLLRKDESGTVKPGLATKWSYNKDQTVLTLTLREGQKFTDGAVVDANAVVKNIVANRDSAGPSAGTLKAIDAVKAKGKTEVEITLSDTDPALLEALAEGGGVIASPKSINSVKAKTKPVGSGPFTLDSTATKFGSQYVFKANPKHWDSKNNPYGKLVLKFIGDSTAVVNALTTGAVQGARVDSINKTTLAPAGVKFVSGRLNILGIYFADRNGKKVPALAEVKVRQAMNMVFDRAQMNQAIENGTANPTQQYVSSLSKAYLPALNSKYKFDVEGAKKLMAEAGYPNGFKITMPTLSGVFGSTIYAVIKAQLAKIDIEVVEEQATLATFLSDNQKGKWAAYLGRFESSINPWKMFNFMLTPDALYNADDWYPSALSTLIGRYQGASDDATRIALAKRVNTYLVEQAAFVPFYEPEAVFAFKGIKVRKFQAGSVIPFLYNIK